MIDDENITATDKLLLFAMLSKSHPNEFSILEKMLIQSIAELVDRIKQLEKDNESYR